MAKDINLYDQVLGCLLGAAVGDAMGSATETQSTKQIAETFGGRVRDFQIPPENSLAAGRRAAQITDAFSIPYILTQHLLGANGQASRKIGEDALREWGQSEYFGTFAGMTTRKVVNTLNEDSSMGAWAYAGHLGNKLFKGHYYALSSNGAAVKAYPAGLLNPGKPDQAIADALELTMASHDDPLSISGACAVAAAVSQAMAGKASIYEMVQAALYGAKKGEALARQRQDVWVYPGPSVTKRLEMAINIVMKGGNPIRHMENLRDYIGSGPAIAETVPTAFGLFIASQGETMPAIYDAVNIGDETSAIAAIAGALCGVKNGATSITDGYLDRIEAANNLDIRGQARQITELIGQP
jgi:ADP-ribosylglycohydrolase